MVELPDPELIAHYFSGEFDFKVLESGHINRTFLANNNSGKKFIIQCINSNVFDRPEQVIENFSKVSRVCHNLIPQLIHTQSGQEFVKSGKDIWRAFEYVDDTRTILQIQNEDQAYYGSRMFGTFLAKCSVIDPLEVKETIPDFHNLNRRITDFIDANKADKRKRASELRKVIPELDKYFFLGKDFQKAKESLPERVVHNDTKPSNILYAQNSDKAEKVIDLDTVMPGLTITDFGDMVRSFTPYGAEDDPDPASSEVRRNILNAIREGFLESTEGFLLPEEKSILMLGAKCIIFEQALRFFTDFLLGDYYYKTNRQNQNLDRGIHQLNILQSV